MSTNSTLALVVAVIVAGVVVVAVTTVRALVEVVRVRSGQPRP
ncbi:hypothetical protein [Streptomyces olivaceus]